MWAGADSVLHALGGVDTATTTMSTSFSSRIMVDPYISYINENGHEHHLKTRFFRTDNQKIPIKQLPLISILENISFNNNLKISSLLQVEPCLPILT